MSASTELALERGMQIGEYAITAVISCGRHATVVQARDAAGRFVALKLPTTTVGEELIAHEQQVLSTLSRAVDAGMYDGRPYSATDWVVGAEARVVAADSADRRHLLQVCRAVARAYAGVHAAGVVHGQVHPRHVLMEDGADATLLDFSVAASAGIAPPPARLEARFSSLAAPEQARALLEGREPRLTPEAEQFSVAALLYLLVTGRMYATLRLQRDLLPVDIVDASPSPFADLGLEPWPDLERVLARSMSQDPTQRYPSAAALLAALEEVGAGAERVRRDLRSMSALAQKLQEFRRDTYSTEAIRSLAPPTCSINFGAAGVAFALTRLGTITGDPVPIEHAGRWLSAADERSNDPDAFDDGDELTPESIGSVSPFHALSGLAVARAFWSEAVGDEDLRQAALDEYRVATARPCDSLDLTLGRSSVLLVAGLLLDRTDPALPAAGRLASYGDELCEAIWRDVEDQRLPYNGIAHGWAGLAYASMLWSRVRGVAPPPGARRALEMLAALAEPFGRGARWLVSPNGGPDAAQFWPGWCHGNAGYAFLWTEAETVYGEPGFGLLADRAAHLANAASGVSSLCCGTAGQVYSLLGRYRATGDERWRLRAVHLAERSAAEDTLAGDATSPLSLYKGHVGLALLAVELEHPERAAMPLFELEPPLGAQLQGGHAENLGYRGPVRARTGSRSVAKPTEGVT